MLARDRVEKDTTGGEDGRWMVDGRDDLDVRTVLDGGEMV